MPALSGDPVAPGASAQQTVRIGPPMYGGSFAATTDLSSSASIEVPFTLAGELVRIDASTKGGMATLMDVLEASPSRVEARCRHFGACGGCQYQHIAAPEQVRIKTQLLASILSRQGITLPPSGVQPHAAEPWQYRNRMRLRLSEDRIGYSLRRSNEFLPIAECPIVSPLLWRAAQHVEQASARWPAGASEVELFASDSDDAMQMALHLDATVESIDRSAPTRFRELCNTLAAALPELKGAGLLVQQPTAQAASRRVQERQRVEVARWGEPSLTYRVGNYAYTVSRSAFFQVNRFLTSRMVDLVIGNRSGSLALDLFAGAGLFSLPLTERFDRVIAVEIGLPAAADLRNALSTRGAQHSTEHKTTLAFLREWNLTGGKKSPDLIVMDPPRAGLGREAVSELVRLDAEELAYVSCDPQTLARDAKALVESRYTLEEVHLLDLFPQTFHLETVAIFRRR